MLATPLDMVQARTALPAGVTATAAALFELANVP